MPQYPPTRPEAAKAIIGYLSADHKEDKATLNALISVCRPHGSIREAHIEETQEGLRAHMRIEGIGSKIVPAVEDGWRYVDPLAIPVCFGFSLYGGPLRIGNVTSSPRKAQGKHPLHYVYLLGERRITLQRFLAGAGPGQGVKLSPENHRDLCIRSLLLDDGLPWLKDAREEAITAALLRYEKAAERSLTYGLSASSYKALLRQALAAFDEAHAHELRRVPAVQLREQEQALAAEEEAQ